MSNNGARLARTFVSEVGGGALDEGHEYLCRARCTRCIPDWRGPVHRLSDFIIERMFTPDPEAARLAVMDLARVDVLAHIDRWHHGKLR